jgi:hypothetical protein
MDIPDLIDFAPPECLERGFDLDWYMTRAERFALLHLLAKFKPDLSLEVGTFRGGSLQALSLHSKHVISVDIDPQASARLAGRYDNVTYKVGDSSIILPNLIDQYGDDLGFILIDGNHGEQGVRTDINSVLRIKPRRPLGIVMHDSFMPCCRQGMRTASWAGSPYVHYVELDFVPGCIVPNYSSVNGVMVGGFGFALLRSEPRTSDLEIFESQIEKFNAIKRYAEDMVVRRKPSLLRRGANKLQRILHA